MSDFDSAPTEMLDLTMASGEVTEEYINHIRKINDVFYDQIKIADQKAAYIFTFMLAFLISSAEGRSVFDWALYAKADIPEALLRAILACASVFSIICAILVVLPATSPARRLSSGEPGRIIARCSSSLRRTAMSLTCSTNISITPTSCR